MNKDDYFRRKSNVLENLTKFLFDQSMGSAFFVLYRQGHFSTNKDKVKLHFLVAWKSE
jgi:hypothetical protein